MSVLIALLALFDPTKPMARKCGTSQLCVQTRMYWLIHVDLCMPTGTPTEQAFLSLKANITPLFMAFITRHMHAVKRSGAVAVLSASITRRWWLKIGSTFHSWAPTKNGLNRRLPYRRSALRKYLCINSKMLFFVTSQQSWILVAIGRASRCNFIS